VLNRHVSKDQAVQKIEVQRCLSEGLDRFLLGPRMVAGQRRDSDVETDAFGVLDKWTVLISVWPVLSPRADSSITRRSELTGLEGWEWLDN